MISLVMPVYNEEAIIAESLGRLAKLTGDHEVIVVDSGSSDRTAEIAETAARTIKSTKGRGIQMNTGATAAAGDILLFLHSYTILPDNAIGDITKALENPTVIGGTLSKRYDSNHFLLKPARYYTYTNFYIFGLISGDQGIFVRHGAFNLAGGFPDVPLMEEFGLVKRLRKIGPLVFLPAEAIVSSRRFAKKGVARTYLSMLRCVTLYKLGVPPEKIAAAYRDVR
jgi:rSAM/selenodomain-associated transferase 2